jgi:two-component sensor histidine kinase
MPENFDWKNSKSLGLRIVGILVKQIDGEITLDRSKPGTRFELRFPASSGAASE